MDAAMARKYLSGEVTLDEASQSSSTEQTQTPSEVTSSNGDEDGKNPDESQTQLETPVEPSGSQDTGTATQSSEDHSDDTGTEDQSKGAGKQNPKKDPKLPYPKATPKDAKEYKANKAFIKQKQKFQAKLAAQQAEIENLKAQLMKANAISEESLADKPSELMDLKINKTTLSNQIKNLEKSRNDAIEEQANAEAELIHQQRIERCFTDETEANHYQTLLANGRDKFVDFLAKYDPESTILQYLDDCDNSPLMVQVLMTNPEVLKRVVEIRNPLNKTIELRSLENRIMMERKLRKTVGKAPTAAKKLPSTGSQVGAGAGSDKAAVRDSNYWRNYLQTH